MRAGVCCDERQGYYRGQVLAIQGHNKNAGRRPLYTVVACRLLKYGTINCMNKRPDFAAFFAAYAQRFNDALTGKINVEGTIKSFASCFIEASPTGIICSKNDHSFVEAIRKGYAFYKSIGTERMEIKKLQPTILDAFHATVKVCWGASYRKKMVASKQLIFKCCIFFKPLQTNQRYLLISPVMSRQ